MANEIDKQSLYKLHEEKSLNERTNNSYNAIEAINALGGIDNVMSNYLNEENKIEIYKDELNELYKILTTRKKYKLDEINKDLESHYKLSLDEDDSYLQSMFGEQITKKILIFIVHSKYIQMVTTLSVIIWFLFAIWRRNSFLYLIYSLTVCGVVWIPYNIFWILSANIAAFKQIMISFEYWLKLAYVTAFGVLHCIYTYRSDADYSLRRLRLYNAIMLLFLLLFVITFVASFDAFNINKVWKILTSATLASIFSYHAIQYGLLINSETDYFYHGETTGIIFSFCGAMSATLGILASFLWKQSLKKLYFYAVGSKKNCVSLCYFPYIEWNVSENASGCMRKRSNMVYSEYMDRTLLHKLHTEQLLNEISNQRKTVEIIDILGGINVVLSNYLNPENGIFISEDALNKVYKIFTGTNQYEPDELDEIYNDAPDINVCLEMAYTLNLEADDCYLQSMFSSYLRNKIMKYIVHNKFIQIITTLSALVWFILILTDNTSSNAYSIYAIFVCCGVWIPYEIFWILSANKIVCKMVVCSFELWFKLIFCICYAILNCFYSYNQKHATLRFGAVIVLMLHIQIFITLVSLFDAFNINKIWKILISATTATMFGIWSVRYLYLINDESTGVSISMCSLMSAMLGILSIFIWEQSSKTLWIYIKKIEKCVVIRYYPYIDWSKHININIPQYQNVFTNSDDHNQQDWINDNYDI